MEEVYTPGTKTIEEVANYLGLDKKQTMKALLFVKYNEEGEEDEDIEPLQRESYEHLMAVWNNLEREILDEILSYYTNLRSELGFDDNSNDYYPDVSTAEGIRDMIGLDTIVVPSSDIYDGRSIALAFHCTWDDENGLGVVLVDEEVREVGYQDIAL